MCEAILREVMIPIDPYLLLFFLIYVCSSWAEYVCGVFAGRYLMPLP